MSSSFDWVGELPILSGERLALRWHVRRLLRR